MTAITNSPSAPGADDQTPWYLGINSEAQGPLTMDEVRALFKDGQANGKTQAWTAGMTDWVAAETLDSLKALIKPPAIKPPPLKVTPPVLPLAPSTKAAAEPSVAAAPVVRPVPENMTPDQQLEHYYGLTPARIDAMATLAVELADQTKVSLKLSPPVRLGLVQPTH